MNGTDPKKLLCFLMTGTGLLFFVSLILTRAFPESEVLTALWVTALTTAYHVVMRLIVGETVNMICKKHPPKIGCRWFCARRFEKKLYRALRVKKWKDKLITAKPEYFDLDTVTPIRLWQNMAQAEIVHEIIMVLSFVPVGWVPAFGAPWAFILTSALAAAADGAFVAIQRYNRPRVEQWIKRRQRENDR